MRKKNIDDRDFSFFRPDKTKLDEEWVKQPALAFKLIKEYELALARLEEVKTDLDLVRASIDPKIRAKPTKYGIGKDVRITETVVMLALVKRKRYREALTKVREVQHTVGILRAATRAIEHRKKALEKLVDLHGQNYFATPRATGETSREMTDEFEKTHIRGKKKRKKF